MTTIKRLFIMLVAALIAVVSAAGQEMSVEESYLQESIELMVIRETSRSDSRDQKMVALQYINEAISRGNKGEDIRQALEYLSLEGIMNQARENGRVVNNYPDVRRQAARYLGELGTPEAKNTLVKVCLADNEPMVLQEAVKSIGDINTVDNDDSMVAAIAWVASRFDMLKPDNMLALSAIETLEKIAARNNGIKDPNAARLLITISENPSYIKPVQDRARQALTALRKYQAK
jgi:HEAT repeat protein